MTCRDINELTAVAQAACRLFLNECKKSGLNIFITETYRSQERQNELYEQGRTKLWDSNGKRLKIVTWTKNSRHTSRRAWDIACKGKDLYNMSTLRKCGEIATKLGITWGGTWKSSPDYPHFEVSENWKAPKTEEVKKMEKRYNNINEVPEWGKATIQQLINKGAIADARHLDLSEDMVRTLVIWARFMA